MSFVAAVEAENQNEAMDLFEEELNAMMVRIDEYTIDDPEESPDFEEGK